MAEKDSENVNLQLEESLSALVDGEANELEVRRILKQFDDLSEADAEQLLAKWQRYHQAGDLLRTSMSVNTPLTASFPVESLGIDDELLAVDPQQADFLLAVRKGIDAPNAEHSESSVATTSSKSGHGWQNFAVAATVALAVLLGVNQYQTPSSVDSLAQTTFDQEAVVENTLRIADRANNQAVNALSDEQLATQLDAAQAQKRLNEYLLQHANHASQQSGQGMMPFARMANFEQQ